MMLTKLIMHTLEEMSIQQVKVVHQQVSAGIIPAPPPPVPQGKHFAKRSYQGQLLKLELMLEIKKRILEKQKMIEKHIGESLSQEERDQLKTEIQEIETNIEKIKGEN